MIFLHIPFIGNCAITFCCDILCCSLSIIFHLCQLCCYAYIFPQISPLPRFHLFIPSHYIGTLSLGVTCVSPSLERWLSAHTDQPPPHTTVVGPSLTHFDKIFSKGGPSGSTCCLRYNEYIHIQSLLLFCRAHWWFFNLTQPI